MFGVAAFVLGFGVMIFGHHPGYTIAERNEWQSSIMKGFPLTGAIIGLVVAALHVSSVEARNFAERNRYKAAVSHREREAKLRRDRAKSLYAMAYADYQPKWQAWREAMKTHEAELAAYQVWRAKFVAAWQAYHERGKEAAKLFERIHANVQMRGRVELELTEPEHMQALFREAIAESSKSNPDLGILRLATPETRWKVFNSPQGPLTREELRAVTHDLAIPEGVVVREHEAKAWLEGRLQKQAAAIVEYNLPELTELCEDHRLEAVRDLLPPMPPIDKVAHEHRTPPPTPERPEPPGNLIFGYPWEPPVPPDRVVWS